MKVQFALLAQSASIDRFSNRLSVFNLLESIESQSFPVFIPEVVFVCILRREAGDLVVSDGTLSVFSGDSIVGKANVRVDFESAQHSRLIVNFQPVPLMKPENLRFQLDVTNGPTYSLDIPVTQTKPAPAPLPAPGD